MDPDGVDGGGGGHPTPGGVSRPHFEDVPSGTRPLPRLSATSPLCHVLAERSWSRVVLKPDLVSAPQKRGPGSGVFVSFYGLEIAALSHTFRRGAPPASGKSLPRAGAPHPHPRRCSAPRARTALFGEGWGHGPSSEGNKEAGRGSSQTRGGGGLDLMPPDDGLKPDPLAASCRRCPRSGQSTGRSRPRASHSWGRSKRKPGSFSFPKAASFPTGAKRPHPHGPLGRPGAGRRLPHALGGRRLPAAGPPESAGSFPDLSSQPCSFLCGNERLRRGEGWAGHLSFLPSLFLRPRLPREMPGRQAGPRRPAAAERGTRGS